MATNGFPVRVVSVRGVLCAAAALAATTLALHASLQPMSIEDIALRSSKEAQAESNTSQSNPDPTDFSTEELELLQRRFGVHGLSLIHI